LEGSDLGWGFENCWNLQVVFVLHMEWKRELLEFLVLISIFQTIDCWYVQFRIKRVV